MRCLIATFAREPLESRIWLSVRTVSEGRYGVEGCKDRAEERKRRIRPRRHLSLSLETALQRTTVRCLVTACLSIPLCGLWHLPYVQFWVPIPLTFSLIFTALQPATPIKILHWVGFPEALGRGDANLKRGVASVQDSGYSRGRVL